MFARIYLLAGAVLVGTFAIWAWNGWEPFGARQVIPAAGTAIVASSWHRSSGGSHWYSSSTRSGGSVFGGK